MPHPTPEPRPPESFSVRLLKWFVFGIAPALFVVGGVVLVYAFNHRPAPTPAVPTVPVLASPAPATLNFQQQITLPKNASLKQAFVSDGNLILHIRQGGDSLFQVISLQNGKTTGEIAVQK
jgi:tellurite resistance protein TehA-like permease